ncbi:hypothetical protein ACO2Q3_18970 [Caulobacter sp. KR2-114]|uniref:GHMP family kinase ATP-binding protein n=1 Tax=Caulobacter sp. KR2-114 TaxID=3400912 RepID=UPI003C05A929
MREFVKSLPTSYAAYGVARCPGTCGEFVQGFTSDGCPFHVTLPVNAYSEVTIWLGEGVESPGALAEYPKLRRAVYRVLEQHGVVGLEPRALVKRTLPIGKGMASSTADIVAAAAATYTALGRSFTELDLASIAAGIESSDGVMYAGVCAVNHRSGQLLGRLADIPVFTVLAVLPPESMDTSSVVLSRRSSAQHTKILAACLDQKVSRSAGEWAELATMSARLNQMDNPNQIFDALYRVRDELSPLGFVVGHTGTVVGLLFEPGGGGEAAARTARDKIASYLGNKVECRTLRVEPTRSWGTPLAGVQ